MIAALPQGAVFSGADFLSAGTRAAVDQTLYRMANAGDVVRIARGLYAVAGDAARGAAGNKASRTAGHTASHVAGDDVAAAVAHKTGEHIGGALPHVSNAAIVVVPTSGQTRTVMAGGQHVQFRRMSQRKIKLSQTPHGRVLLGLWARGAKALTTLDIQHATGDWPHSEIDAYAPLIPAWLHTAVKQSNAPKKSVSIGLSGPYDWSNPHIKDKVLIGHVLEKHRFEDVLRLCLYYGVAKVKRVFKHCALDPITSTSVARMLRNIHKGITWAKEGGVHAQTLPKRAIDGVLNDLVAGGAAIESLITAAQKSKFKINTAEHLDDYVQDYLIDGAKVTFHARHERDRPQTQIDFLKSTKKLKAAAKGFHVLGLDGLFVMKSIVVYDRVKSRDIYDLMVLMREHGYTLAQAFAAIDAYQPARDKDPERFKSVVTGNIPLDANDEGFASIHLNVKMQDVYRYFKKSMDAYEIDLVKTALQTATPRAPR